MHLYCQAAIPNVVEDVKFWDKICSQYVQYEACTIPNVISIYTVVVSKVHNMLIETVELWFSYCFMLEIIITLHLFVDQTFHNCSYLYTLYLWDLQSYLTVVFRVHFLT